MDTLGPAFLKSIERLSSLQRLKCTSMIEKGPQSGSFIQMLSTLQRLKCSSIIEKTLQSVEVFFPLCPLLGVSIMRRSVHYGRPEGLEQFRGSALEW